MKNFNREELPDMFGKLLWENPENPYVINSNIVEYDMRSASLSVSRRFHLLSDTLLDELERMPKEQRTKRIGLIQRDDKQFSENMINGILQTRKEFIETNNIKEEDIVALHSDALMFIQKQPVQDNIAGVQFVCKNTWTSYIRYEHLEMFYDDGTITYKGMPQAMIQQHTLGINRYLLTIFEKLESDDQTIFDFIRKFQKKYLMDKLPDYYYISFGKTGQFKFDNLKFFSFIAKIACEEIL